MSTPAELQVVRTRSALPDAGLAAGAIGTLLLQLDADTWLVEFCDGDGQTLAELPLRADQFETASA